MVKKPSFVKKAIDMFEGKIIKYPPPKGEAVRKYDFHFTKKGKWYYINSCSDLARFANQCNAITDKGQHYRIVESATGKVVKTSVK